VYLAYSIVAPLWALGVAKLWRWRRAQLKAQWLPAQLAAAELPAAEEAGSPRSGGSSPRGGGGGGGGAAAAPAASLPPSGGPSPRGGARQRRGARASGGGGTPRGAEAAAAAAAAATAAAAPPPARLYQLLSTWRDAEGWGAPHGLRALLLAAPLLAAFAALSLWAYIESDFFWARLRRELGDPSWPLPVLSRLGAPPLTLDAAPTLSWLALNALFASAGHALCAWLARVVLGAGAPPAREKALATTMHTALLLFLFHAPFVHVGFVQQDLPLLASRVAHFMCTQRLLLNPLRDRALPLLQLAALHALHLCRGGAPKAGGGGGGGGGGAGFSGGAALLEFVEDAPQLDVDGEYTQQFLHLSVMITWGAVFPLAPLVHLLGDLLQVRVDVDKMGSCQRAADRGGAALPLLLREKQWAARVAPLAYAAAVFGAALQLAHEDRLGRRRAIGAWWAGPAGRAAAGASAQDLWSVLLWEHCALCAMAAVDTLIPDP